jgi:hypothetical protein
MYEINTKLLNDATLSVTLPTALKATVEALAIATGLSASHLVRMALYSSLPLTYGHDCRINGVEADFQAIFARLSEKQLAEQATRPPRPKNLPNLREEKSRE